MKLTEILKGREQLAVFTGAGISTASGIPDFVTRDKEWLYEAPRYELMSLPSRDRRRFCC